MSTAVATEQLLDVKGLRAGYNGRAVIFDIDLEVRRGEVLVVLGGNGAGKTTTLRSISRHIPRMAGDITFAGDDMSGRSPSQAASQGMSIIPAERFTFAPLSVRVNLALGAYNVSSAEVREEREERAFELFPILKTRLDQLAGTMSGGEQRMLSVAIALMSGPKLLLLDEPSLGLAPAVADTIMATVRELVDKDGMSVLMVEQNIGQALRIADRALVMRSGRIILSASAEQLRARDEWWDLF